MSEITQILSSVESNRKLVQELNKAESVTYAIPWYKGDKADPAIGYLYLIIPGEIFLFGYRMRDEKWELVDSEPLINTPELTGDVWSGQLLFQDDDALAAKRLSDISQWFNLTGQRELPDMEKGETALSNSEVREIMATQQDDCPHREGHTLPSSTDQFGVDICRGCLDLSGYTFASEPISTEDLQSAQWVRDGDDVEQIQAGNITVLASAGNEFTRLDASLFHKTLSAYLESPMDDWKIYDSHIHDGCLFIHEGDIVGYLIWSTITHDWHHRTMIVGCSYTPNSSDQSLPELLQWWEAELSPTPTWGVDATLQENRGVSETEIESLSGDWMFLIRPPRDATDKPATLDQRLSEYIGYILQSAEDDAEDSTTLD